MAVQLDYKKFAPNESPTYSDDERRLAQQILEKQQAEKQSKVIAKDREEASEGMGEGESYTRTQDPDAPMQASTGGGAGFSMGFNAGPGGGRIRKLAQDIRSGMQTPTMEGDPEREQQLERDAWAMEGMAQEKARAHEEKQDVIDIAMGRQAELDQARTQAYEKFSNDLGDAQLESKYFKIGDVGQIKELQAAAAQGDPEAQRRLDAASKVEYNPSIGRKLTSAIAMAFGAYGAALTGTPNYAMQIVNDTIQREIDSQKDMKYSARSRVGQVKSQYAMMRQKLGDDQAAEQATKGLLLGQAADKLEGLSMQMQDLGQVQKAQGAVYQLRQQQEQAFEGAKQQAIDNQIKLAQVDIAANRLDAARVEASMRQQAAAAKAQKQGQLGYGWVAGPAAAQNAGAVSKAREATIGYERLIDTFEKAVKARATYGTGDPRGWPGVRNLTDFGSDAEAAANDLKREVKNVLAEAGAALTKIEEEKLMAFAPDSMAEWGTFQSGIEKTLDYVRDKYAIEMEGFGYSRAKQDTKAGRFDDKAESQ